MKTKRTKNCMNCKHLEWVEAEAWDNNGYACNHRKYRTDSEEETHLAQLEYDSYLNAPKKCCELKEAND
jgi:hypothetical protein